MKTLIRLLIEVQYSPICSCLESKSTISSRCPGIFVAGLYHTTKLKLVPLHFAEFRNIQPIHGDCRRSLRQFRQRSIERISGAQLSLGIADIPTLAEIAYAGNVGFGDFVKLVQPISKVSMRRLLPKTDLSSPNVWFFEKDGPCIWISAPEKPSNAAESQI